MSDQSEDAKHIEELYERLHESKDKSRVRVQAIRGLPLFCPDSPEYILKIVDILIQLLSAEDFVERDAVHKALMSLLRQDVKASLSRTHRKCR